MEHIPLDMEDIFGDLGGGGLEEDLQGFPEEHEPEAQEVPAGDGDGIENSAEVLNRLKKLGGAAKRVVKRPQPKLDADRLTGERGIGVLPGLFKDMKFKGKGYEAVDLKQIMQKLEHWAHRLFPKMTFDEVLERTERLGSKKPVQTCVKRIRLDMPVLGQETVEDEGDMAGQEGETTLNGVDIDEDPFDVMLRQEREKEERNRASSSFFPSSPIPSTSAGFSPQPSTSKPSPPQSTLTPEQRERMERNKRLAMERRAARARQEGEKTGESTVDTSSSHLTPGPASESQEPPSSSSPASPRPEARGVSQPPSPAPSSPRSTQTTGGSESCHDNASAAMAASQAAEEDNLATTSSDQEMADTAHSSLPDSQAPTHSSPGPEKSPSPDSTSVQDDLPDSQTPDSQQQDSQTGQTTQQAAAVSETEADPDEQGGTESTGAVESSTPGRAEEEMEAQAVSSTGEQGDEGAGAPTESSTAGQTDEDA